MAPASEDPPSALTSVGSLLLSRLAPRAATKIVGTCVVKAAKGSVTGAGVNITDIAGAGLRTADGARDAVGALGTGLKVGNLVVGNRDEGCEERLGAGLPFPFLLFF